MPKECRIGVRFDASVKTFLLAKDHHHLLEGTAHPPVHNRHHHPFFATGEERQRWHRERERERDLCFRGKSSTHHLAPRLMSYPPSGGGDDTTVLLKPKCTPRQGSQCYSTSPQDRNRLNRNHLDQSLSSSKKNRNSLTWVLMAFDSVFYLLSHLP